MGLRFTLLLLLVVAGYVVAALLALGTPLDEPLPVARLLVSRADAHGAPVYAPTEQEAAIQAIALADEKLPPPLRPWPAGDEPATPAEPEAAAGRQARLAEEATAAARNKVHEQTLERLAAIEPDLTRAQRLLDELEHCRLAARNLAVEVVAPRLWQHEAGLRLSRIREDLRAEDFLGAYGEAESLADDLTDHLDHLEALRSAGGC